MSSSAQQGDYAKSGTARSLAGTSWTIAGSAACAECVVVFGSDAESSPYSGTLDGKPILWDENLLASPPQFVILAASSALWPNLSWTGTWANGSGSATLNSWTQDSGSASATVTVMMTQTG